MSEQLLKQILDELKGTKDEVKSIKDEVNSIKNEVNNIKDEVNSIKNEQQSMKKTIMTIQETMATKEDVADIPAMKLAIFETSETVKRMEVTQGKQEQTLDLLSRRSIDQEAELRKMR